MEENKKELKSKYGDAKTLGLLVNESRDKINELKRMLENEKCSSFSSDANPSHEKQPENISKLSAMIEEEKSRYRENFNRLRDLKSEIESIQQLMERNRIKIQSDFDHYYEAFVRNMRSSSEVQHLPANTLPPITTNRRDVEPNSTLEAWRGKSPIPPERKI
eukprot:TRINITY_DN5168_c0_g1_i11.p1 TRINITY_DN5168_c0_g1~~TRINITY_DN5168_c0_g1_i11.p1  ORF type:complete len:162 (+),score=30.50 TRINITY_DN5168_c0_g1_i11:507-992(+)